MIEQITINMHSSIRIQGDRVIYFDPYGIEEETHDADVIFITHDHYDHFDPDSINKVIRDDTLLVIPRSSMDAWSESEIIATQMVQMDPGQAMDMFGMIIETIPAYNHMKPFHPRRNEWLGYIVTTDDRRVYVAGDTDLTDEAKEVKCDIAFVPVGGKYTMNAEKAAELVNLIKPDIAVPTHYGSIVGKPGDGRAFKELVDEDILVPLLIRHRPADEVPPQEEEETAEEQDADEPQVVQEPESEEKIAEEPENIEKVNEAENAIEEFEENEEEMN